MLRVRNSGINEMPFKVELLPIPLKQPEANPCEDCSRSDDGEIARSTGGRSGLRHDAGCVGKLRTYDD